MRGWHKLVLILVGLVVGFSTLVFVAPLTALDLLTPRSSYHKVADLIYGDQPRNLLDVYTPTESQGAAPVIVFFYGGSWNSGERGDYRFVGEALASRGIVTVVADYRLYPQVRYPDFLHDAAQAVAWTEREIARYGGDPQRVFLMGHSAGAYNAAMLALDERLLAQVQLTPNSLRGWIGLAGPYDFLPVINPAVRPVFFYPDSPLDSQPINHVSAAAPPALLLASRDDPTVNPQRNSGGLAQRLRTAGVPVVEAYFTRTDHVTLVAALAAPLRGLAPVLDSVERFVKSDGGRVQLTAVLNLPR